MFVLGIGALLRPLITRLTVLTGVVGLLLFGLLTQAVILGSRSPLVPTVEPFSLGEIVRRLVGRRGRRGVRQLARRHLQRRGLPRPGAGPGRPAPDRPGSRRAGAAGRPARRRQRARCCGRRSRRARCRRCRAGSAPASTRSRLAHRHAGDDAGGAGRAAARRRPAVPGFRWYDKAPGPAADQAAPRTPPRSRPALRRARAAGATAAPASATCSRGDAPTQLLTVSHARLPGTDRGPRRSPRCASASCARSPVRRPGDHRVAPGPPAADAATSCRASRAAARSCCCAA